MIDRQKTAVALVLVGAGLAVLGSFQTTYSTSYQPGPEAYTTSLWIVTSARPVNASTDAYYVNGYPMIVAVVLMVAAAVFLNSGGKAAAIARPVVLAAAGGLAGIVLTYVLQVLHEEDLINALQGDSARYLVTFGIGTYLLVVGAVIGLVGAVLMRQRQEREPAEADEDEVVVHQLDSDDDTPPFGIAVLELEKQQETR